MRRRGGGEDGRGREEEETHGLAGWAGGAADAQLRSPERPSFTQATPHRCAGGHSGGPGKKQHPSSALPKRIATPLHRHLNRVPVDLGAGEAGGKVRHRSHGCAAAAAAACAPAAKPSASPCLPAPPPPPPPPPLHHARPLACLLNTNGSWMGSLSLLRYRTYSDSPPE